MILITDDYSRVCMWSLLTQELNLSPRLLCGADYFTVNTTACLSMHHQCEPGSFFSTSTQEPGNEADMDHDQLTDLFPYHAGPV